MIIIYDNNVCPKCGAYFQNNGYCANGHIFFWGTSLREYKGYIEKVKEMFKPINSRFEILDIRK